eukprot:scaffold112463_cov20-Tisochrysis_lutea.AAC.1
MGLKSHFEGCFTQADARTFCLDSEETRDGKFCEISARRRKGSAAWICERPAGRSKGLSLPGDTLWTAGGASAGLREEQRKERWTRSAHGSLASVMAGAVEDGACRYKAPLSADRFAQQLVRPIPASLVITAYVIFSFSFFISLHRFLLLPGRGGRHTGPAVLYFDSTSFSAGSRSLGSATCAEKMPTYAYTCLHLVVVASS